MSSDAFSKKSEAKGIIQNALMGLGLAMSAWLIVALVLPPGGKDCPSDSFCFDLSLDAIALPKNENPPGSGGTTGTPGPGASSLTQAEVEAKFKAANIGFSRGIQLTGLQEKTIDELARLKNVCRKEVSNCNVIVTSATGGNHASGEYSHANGYKVDLKSQGEGGALTSYITSHYTELSPRSNGDKAFISPSGAIYVLESDHWDVVVK